jgi:hypothetical protein
MSPEPNVSSLQLAGFDLADSRQGDNENVGTHLCTCLFFFLYPIFLFLLFLRIRAGLLQLGTRSHISKVLWLYAKRLLLDLSACRSL